MWAFAPAAQAYLDPGTGSALLQGLIGGAAVAAGLVAHYWRRIQGLFTKGGGTPTERERPGA